MPRRRPSLSSKRSCARVRTNAARGPLLGDEAHVWRRELLEDHVAPGSNHLGQVDPGQAFTSAARLVKMCTWPGRLIRLGRAAERQGRSKLGSPPMAAPASE